MALKEGTLSPHIPCSSSVSDSCWHFFLNVGQAMQPRAIHATSTTEEAHSPIFSPALVLLLAAEYFNNSNRPCWHEQNTSYQPTGGYMHLHLISPSAPVHRLAADMFLTCQTGYAGTSETQIPHPWDTQASSTILPHIHKKNSLDRT